MQNKVNNNSVLKEYTRLAKSYDSRWRDYLEKTQKTAVNCLSAKNNDLVLDIGCGTGGAAIRIAKKLTQGKIVGIDTCQAMLDLAKKKSKNFKNITYKNASAEKIPFPTKYFDKIISVSAFHHFQNPNTAVKEMCRVIKPKGIIVILDWCRDYFLFKILNLWWRLTNKAHVKAYDTKEISKILEKEGVKIIEKQKFKIKFFWRLMMLKGEK